MEKMMKKNERRERERGREIRIIGNFSREKNQIDLILLSLGSFVLSFGNSSFVLRLNAVLNHPKPSIRDHHRHPPSSYFWSRFSYFFSVFSWTLWAPHVLPVDCSAGVISRRDFASFLLMPLFPHDHGDDDHDLFFSSFILLEHSFPRAFCRFLLHSSVGLFPLFFQTIQEKILKVLLGRCWNRWCWNCLHDDVLSFFFREIKSKGMESGNKKKTQGERTRWRSREKSVRERSKKGSKYCNLRWQKGHSGTVDHDLRRQTAISMTKNTSKGITKTGGQREERERERHFVATKPR